MSRRRPISVRTARTADSSAIAELTRQLGYDLSAGQLEARLQRILSRSDQHVFVAELEKQPVAWMHVAIVEPIEAERFVMIGGLVVDRDHRQQGIGRLLMGHAERWARARGCSIVRLWSTTSRTGAHRFYERLGYMNVKTQHSFVKLLSEAGADKLRQFVPRVEP